MGTCVPLCPSEGRPHVFGEVPLLRTLREFFTILNFTLYIPKLTWSQTAV